MTGAGSGIGASTAERLGADGWAVACLDIIESRAAATADALHDAGVAAVPVVADVSDRDSVAHAFDLVDSLGPLRTVVSNAGIVLRRRLEATGDDEWDETMAVNVRGTFHVVQAAVPRLTKAGGGSIVMVASVVAHVGFGLPAYTASKGAILALTRELAGELAPRGIRVNAVSPGTVEPTRVTEVSLADPAVRARTLAATPLGRIAAPSDIAAAISFLVSDDASMITGHALVVDGGLSAVVNSMRPSGEGP